MIYLLLICASFIWGMNVLVMKNMLTIVPMYFLAALRVGISALSLFLIMKYKKQNTKGVDYKIVIKVSIFAITINFALTFIGMQQISGAQNAVINALAPLITIVVSWIILKNRIEKRQLIAMSIALFGFGTALEWKYQNISVGYGLLVLGMISYCYSNILMQKSRDTSNFLPFSTMYLWCGFLMLSAISIVLEPRAFQTIQEVSLYSWLVFILISGFGFAFIQVVYLYSIKVIGSIKTSFFLSLNPIFTYIGAILFFKEEIEILKIVAFLCMLVALIVGNYKTSATDV